MAADQAHIKDLVAVKCFMVLPPNWSSISSRCTLQKHGASAGRGTTKLDATGQLVLDRVD